MMKTELINKLILAGIFVLGSTGVFAQGVSKVAIGEHVDAQLVAETEHAVPGESLWVALRLDHMEHWHTYWKNPGDAGKPTVISWQLPEGVQAGGIVWPLPERFDLPADLVDFGYTEEVFLLTELSIPASFAEETLAIGAQAQWLECEEICIPGGASVELAIPVNSQTPPAIDNRWVEGFASVRETLPRADISLDAMFYMSEDSINLLVQATESIFENAAGITFIPDTHRILDYISDQEITTQLSSLQLSQRAHSRALREPPQRLGGLLIVEDADGAKVTYEVEAEPGGVTLAALDGSAVTAPVSAT